MHIVQIAKQGERVYAGPIVPSCVEAGPRVGVAEEGVDGGGGWRGILAAVEWWWCRWR